MKPSAEEKGTRRYVGEIMYSRKTIATLVAVVAVMLVAGHAMAQQCQQTPEEFLPELESLIADFYAMGDLAAELDYPMAGELLKAVVDFEVAVAGLDDEEIIEICNLVARSPSLVEMPGRTMQIMLMAEDLLEQDSCDGYNQWIAFGFMVAADIVKLGFDTACTSLSCWKICSACLLAVVTDLTSLATHMAFDVLEGQCFLHHVGLMSTAETNFTEIGADVVVNKQVLVTNLDVAVSSRAAGTEVAGVGTALSVLERELGEPRNEDLVTDLQNIAGGLRNQAADRGAFQDLDVRLSIEEALHSSDDGKISLLQFPESAGGRLEQVREVVAATITMNQEAGEHVYDALHHFTLGDRYLNTGQYSRAFASYRLAYTEAVRESPF